MEFRTTIPPPLARPTASAAGTTSGAESKTASPVSTSTASPTEPTSWVSEAFHFAAVDDPSHAPASSLAKQKEFLQERDANPVCKGALEVLADLQKGRDSKDKKKFEEALSHYAAAIRNARKAMANTVGSKDLEDGEKDRIMSIMRQVIEESEAKLRSIARRVAAAAAAAAAAASLDSPALPR